ncbi:GNAT family N-acetyltransferase [Pelagibacterium halotolerans]|uniref:Regulatory protein for C-P lyase n=1 Tax=Pelagibacterium halotolerans (strain DSM 22347 / JCM 15775 / CGMCC 1.7692 / B2) TaxID=1082931 RepID=G4RGT5_PELHB|nr:GNAT family N-acetyltransferase [Pelagibacterium halotolerans]AEQ52124.1 regulatory protein for C-P lyase [Pelagibacterium halotolerans B2]QJR18107.1 GNAT family N-acetyltransferase [Pelagibacterium halotolerans]SDZ84035.1 Ribosomal protein S18 acetylase RimI [Pelagibacterium halotolerans]
MSDLTIRNATVDDLPFIVGLIAHDTVLDLIDDPAQAHGPDYLAAFQAISSDPNQVLLVAQIDAASVGTFQLTFTPGIFRRGGWRCTIEAVHVSPEHRNKRIGEKMMARAVEMAKERGCTMVQLTSNKKRTDAHRFYERLGFSKSHEGFKLYI